MLPAQPFLYQYHFAAESGDLERVKILWESEVAQEKSGGRTKDIDQANRRGMTALYYACLGGYTDLAEYLLLQGASANGLPEGKRCKCCHPKFPLQIAIRKDHEAIVGLLLKHGANASLVSCVPEKSQGDNEGLFDDNEYTVLIKLSLFAMAIVRDQPKYMSQLLEAKADPKDVPGNDPIQYAASKRAFNATEFLLNKFPLQSPNHLLFYVEKIVSDHEADHVRVKELLQLRLIKLLLVHKVQLSSLFKEQRELITWLVHKEKMYRAYGLLEHLAYAQCIFDHVLHQGFVSLHDAFVNYGWDTLMRRILILGADIDLADARGRSPLVHYLEKRVCGNDGPIYDGTEQIVLTLLFGGNLDAQWKRVPKPESIFFEDQNFSETVETLRETLHRRFGGNSYPQFLLMLPSLLQLATKIKHNANLNPSELNFVANAQQIFKPQEVFEFFCGHLARFKEEFYLFAEAQVVEDKNSKVVCAELIDYLPNAVGGIVAGYLGRRLSTMSEIILLLLGPRGESIALKVFELGADFLLQLREIHRKALLSVKEELQRKAALHTGPEIPAQYEDRMAVSEKAVLVSPAATFMVSGSKQDLKESVARVINSAANYLGLWGSR